MAPDDVRLKETASPTASKRAAKPLALSVAFADYDRTRPLLDGRVKIAGVAPKYKTSWIGDFCTRPVYEEYDIAEMSMSWFTAARVRGEPVVAIPVFPLRMAVLAYMFVRADSPITHPSQLKGKTIATTGYRYTVNLWLRGMLAEHYGLAAHEVKWISNEPETAGYVMPSNIDRKIVPDRSVGEMLISGEADCVIGPEAPEEYHKGDPRIRRLFPDARAETLDFYRRRGYYPATHTVVMKEELARDEPWIAESVMAAFREAQAMCNEFYFANAKHISFPSGVFILEDEKRDYGPDNTYVHGLEPNRKVVEAFVRYAYEQNYIARLPKIEELFAPNTWKL
jgi:4,5-dihydroxyphthalate decarboxylase